MRRLRDLPYRWTLLVAVASVVATAAALWLGAVGDALAAPLLGDAAKLRSGQWWRLWTGPLVHTSGGHLLWDLGMLMFIGVAYEQKLRAVWPTLVVLGMGLPVAAVLIAYPALAGYGGTSGLTYGLMAAVIAFELMRGNRPWYLLAAGAVLAFKVLRELDPGAKALLFEVDLGTGAHPVPVAHLAGVMVGLVVVTAARSVWAPIRTSRSRG